MIGQIGGSRPQYYDRNVVSVGLYYNITAIAPHAGTVRAAYTVPTGKKARVNAVDSWVNILTAAGTPLLRVNTFGWLESGGSTLKQFAAARVGTNVVRDAKAVTIGYVGEFLAGDLLEFVSSDASTTGTAEYAGAALISEFDA